MSHGLIDTPFSLLCDHLGIILHHMLLLIFLTLFFFFFVALLSCFLPIMSNDLSHLIAWGMVI